MAKGNIKPNQVAKQSDQKNLIKFLKLIKQIIQLSFLLGLFFLFILYVFKVDDIGVCPYNKNACYFSEGYLQARAMFREKAREANTILIRQKLSIQNDYDISMDIAILTKNNTIFQEYDSIKDLKNLDIQGQVLVHLSGTHGAEGYTGSAIQTAYLDKFIKNNQQLPDNTTIIFIHSVNPYGYLYNRRQNENNVDLNRNALFNLSDFQVKKNDKTRYEGHTYLDHIVNPKQEWELGYSDIKFFFQLIKESFIKGSLGLKSIIAGAQYFNQKGIMYGGDKYQESIENMVDLLKNKLKISDKNTIIIDVHTGLGPLGMDTLMIKSLKEKQITYDIYDCKQQNENCQVNKNFFIDVDTDPESDVSGGYENVEGTLDNLIQLSEIKNGLFITQEFGTTDGIIVLRGCVQENSNYWFGSQNSKSQGAKSIKNVFYIENSFYKKNTVDRGLILINQTLQAFQNKDLMETLPQYN